MDIDKERVKLWNFPQVGWGRVYDGKQQHTSWANARVKLHSQVQFRFTKILI